MGKTKVIELSNDRRKALGKGCRKSKSYTLASALSIDFIEKPKAHFNRGCRRNDGLNYFC
jgi:hypothetical protein